MGLTPWAKVQPFNERLQHKFMMISNQLKIRGWCPKLLLSIIGIIFTIGFIELGMRLFFGEIPEVLNLGEIADVHPMDDSQFTPKLNDLRFREEPLENVILEQDYTRVLFLGDSFTFGQGVSNGDDRFSDLIEQSIHNQTNFKFHIYNASRPGTEPDNWVEFYNILQPIYQPNHVFAIFFLRDGTNLCTSLRCYEETIFDIKNRYSDSYLYQYSYIGRFFYNQIILQEFSDFYANQILDAYLGDETQTETWKIQQAALRELHQSAIQNGSTFDLIIFPILFDLNRNYRFYSVENEIIHFANEANIPVYSLTSGFIGHNAHDLWVSENDQHPNELGHKLAAETLLPYLMEVINR